MIAADIKTEVLAAFKYHRRDRSKTCEDALQINLATGRFAVADGVSTNACFQYEFAEFISGQFVSNSTDESRLLFSFDLNDKRLTLLKNWGRRLAPDWKSYLEPFLSNEESRIAWLKEKKEAQATFAGIELRRLPDGECHLNYLVVGDCFLFLVKKDGSLDKDDCITDTSSDNPFCFHITCDGDEVFFGGKVKMHFRTIPSKVYVVLATDALGEFLNTRFAEDGRGTLDELKSLHTQDAFNRWITYHRDSNERLAADDVTLIVLEVDPTEKEPAKTELNTPPEESPANSNQDLAMPTDLPENRHPRHDDNSTAIVGNSPVPPHSSFGEHLEKPSPVAQPCSRRQMPSPLQNEFVPSTIQRLKAITTQVIRSSRSLLAGLAIFCGLGLVLYLKVTHQKQELAATGVALQKSVLQATSLAHTLEDREHELSNLRKQHDELQETHSRKTADNEILQKRYDELAEKQTQKTAQLSNSISDNERLRKELGEAQKAQKFADRARGELTKQVGEQNEKIADLQSNSDRERQKQLKLQRELDEIHLKESRLTAEAQDLRKTNAEQKEKLTRIQDENVSLRAVLSQLESTNRLLRNKNIELMSALPFDQTNPSAKPATAKLPK